MFWWSVVGCRGTRNCAGSSGDENRKLSTLAGDFYEVKGFEFVGSGLLVLCIVVPLCAITMSCDGELKRRVM